MTHRTPIDIAQENRRLDRIAPAIIGVAGAIGIVGFGAALLLAFPGGTGTRRLFHSYLVSFAYFLSLSLGALFFVILHHLSRAGWSVVVRRFGEAIAANLWLLGILLIPILIGLDQVYPWTDPDLVARDDLLQHKQVWLNSRFFILRCVAYFAVWIFLSRYFLRHSVAQDASGDIMLTVRMERFSGPGMVLFGISTAFAAFDLLMSLDPLWYSTIFGVYFFAGSVLGFLALLPVITFLLQSTGRLTRAITTEHYHDMGKLIFAFTVFWAYIAYSQYMLIWYANIPEETGWFLRRQTGPWTSVSLLLLFGHFIVPFVVLLPRFVKRSKPLLLAPAIWILVVHWFDLYWLVMPQMSPDLVPLGLIDAACFLGVGGFFVAATALQLRKHSLVPEKDPRLEESLVIESV